MRIQKIKYGAILLLILISQLSFSTPLQVEQGKPTRILFIGNSYSYHNSLSQLVKGLAREKFPNREIETKLISDGGITLKGHWEDTNALDEIRTGEWDFVILQEQSLLGSALVIESKNHFNKPDTFFEYAKKFDSEIKLSGAQTVFFMTWSRKDNPEQQKYLTYAYMTMAMELDALIAPVGLVWNKERDNKMYDLYNRDGSHPSAHGSYLAATTIFATIFKTDPAGIAGKISGYQLSSRGQRAKEISILVDLTSEEASAIQASTVEVSNTLSKAKGYQIIDKPNVSYIIPTLPKGKTIKNEDIEGRWYGVAKYSNSYIGMILDIDHSAEQIKVSYYGPARSLNVVAEGIKQEENKLSFNLIDGPVKTKVNFALTDDGFYGITNRTIGFYGRLTIYDNWIFTRDKVQNEIDLEAMAKITEDYNNNITKIGYTKASIGHFKEYSKIIGSDYKPAEGDLNMEGYMLMKEKNIDQALSVFELNTILYPGSANTYDSYGEALVKAGDKEKAVNMFEQAFIIAKRNNNANTGYFEKNWIRLKKELE
jgi:tetratricopeptide (TPR) repeat protein